MLNIKLSKRSLRSVLLISFIFPVHSMDWFYKNKKAVVAGALSVCGLAGYYMWRNAQKVKADECALSYCASEDFHRGWLNAGLPYTPYELEEMIDHLMDVISQPSYIERVMPLIQKRIIECDTFEQWRILLPLESLSEKESILFFRFFYSLERLAYLTREEIFLTTKHRLDYHSKTVSDIASLATIRHEAEQLRSVLVTINSVIYWAMLHKIEMLTPEATAFIDKSYQQLNLRWIPLAFAISYGIECKTPGFDFTCKQIIQMKLSMIMTSMFRGVDKHGLSYEQYLELTEPIIHQSAMARVALCDVLTQQDKLHKEKEYIETDFHS